MHNCLNCGTSENDRPLVTLTFKESDLFICSSCLPILIHNPQELVGKIKGAENIPPAEHED